MVVLSGMVLACSDPEAGAALEIHGPALDPSEVQRVAIDRFAEARGDDPGLPEAGAPIDFDAAFFAEGLGPDGQSVAYYDFGISASRTMLAYRLVDAEGEPIPEQRAIVSAVPGQLAYSDFWEWVEVEVPNGYVANSITSAIELEEAGYPQTRTREVSNLPLVPEGSAAVRAASQGQLTQVWIEDQLGFAFTFDEAEIRVRGDAVDYVPIYACRTADGSFCVDDQGRTHNVLAAVPTDPSYSPLWRLSLYPQAAFESVVDLASALAADPQEQSMLVNCPVVVW